MKQDGILDASELWTYSVNERLSVYPEWEVSHSYVQSFSCLCKAIRAPEALSF